MDDEFEIVIVPEPTNEPPLDRVRRRLSELRPLLLAIVAEHHRDWGRRFARRPTETIIEQFEEQGQHQVAMALRIMLACNSAIERIDLTNLDEALYWVDEVYNLLTDLADLRAPEFETKSRIDRRPQILGALKTNAMQEAEKNERIHRVSREYHKRMFLADRIGGKASHSKILEEAATAAGVKFNTVKKWKCFKKKNVQRTLELYRSDLGGNR